MNSLLASFAFISHAFLTFLFYDDDVGKVYRGGGKAVAIEIYVHEHSVLSLRLLTEDWYFAISLHTQLLPSVWNGGDDEDEEFC